VSERRDAPTNLRSLDRRIANVAATRTRPVRRIQRVVANAAIGQMLPAGVVKGGTAMKLRVGEAGSRFTPDVDVARSAALSLDDYLDELASRLAAGWSGFTGTVEQLDAAHPDGVPDEYVMQPFDIRLAYLGRHWLKVTFELGHDEVGSTADADLRMAEDIIELFHEIGLDTPAPVPLLSIENQVAQKLHACTSISSKTGGNDRAHDLVDLQILEQEEGLDLAAIAGTARRLFASRRSHLWPPTVVAHPSWAAIYEEAADGLDVLPAVGAAVTWANGLIQRITASNGEDAP
jgi:hypothetical protein